MQKYLMLLMCVFLAALITACSGGDHETEKINAAKMVAFTTDEISGTSGFSVTRDGYLGFTFNSDGTATWSTAAVTSGDPGQTGSGTWAVVDGVLRITDSSSGNVRTFTRLVSETTDVSDTYWQVYDQDLTLSRFYFGAQADRAAVLTMAQNYYGNKLVYAAGLFRMGGAIQGGASTVLTQANANIALYAGILAGDTSGTGNTDGARLGAATFNQPYDITTDGAYYYVTGYDHKYDDNKYKYAQVRRINKTTGVVETLTCIDEDTSKTFYFKHPMGITTDGTYVYVVDELENNIRRIDPTTLVSKVIAGSSTGSSGSNDAKKGVGARFNEPTGITTDGTNLYVADSGNHTIRRIRLTSPYAVSTVAGKAGKSGDRPDDKETFSATYTNARFYQPARITTDGSRLYVTDSRNTKIRVIQIATGKVTTLAGSSRTKPGHQDGTGTGATFYTPWGITTDGANLYVTDLEGLAWDSVNGITQLFDNRIRKIAISTAEVTTIAGGQAGDKSDFQDIAKVGDGTTARFATPHGIIWDGSLAGLLVSNGTYHFTIEDAGIHTGSSIYNCLFDITASAP